MQKGRQTSPMLCGSPVRPSLEISTEAYESWPVTGASRRSSPDTGQDAPRRLSPRVPRCRPPAGTSSASSTPRTAHSPPALDTPKQHNTSQLCLSGWPWANYSGKLERAQLKSAQEFSRRDYWPLGPPKPARCSRSFPVSSQQQGNCLSCAIGLTQQSKGKICPRGSSETPGSWRPKCLVHQVSEQPSNRFSLCFQVQT